MAGNEQLLTSVLQEAHEQHLVQQNQHANQMQELYQQGEAVVQQLKQEKQVDQSKLLAAEQIINRQECHVETSDYGYTKRQVKAGINSLRALSCRQSSANGNSDCKG